MATLLQMKKDTGPCVLCQPNRGRSHLERPYARENQARNSALCNHLALDERSGDAKDHLTGHGLRVDGGPVAGQIRSITVLIR